jgi:hypothetical protein
MRKSVRKYLWSLSLLPFLTSPVSAQILLEDPGAKKSSGPKTASEYFEARESQKSEKVESSGGSDTRYLSLQVGRFARTKAYRWGVPQNVDDPGENILSVTYRIGEWVNSMDLFFRGEFLTYEVDGRHPAKLSFMPMVAFPDAKSGFPLYFAGGAGVGVFTSQVADESDLSFDYQILAGFRDADLFDKFGLGIEFGLKGHVHLFTSGQFSGTFVTIGSVHEF